jgi:hypothetical protein
MSRIVFCNSAAVVGWRGDAYTVRYGEPWYADDPFVLGNPGLFTADPPEIRSTVDRPVESATAAPGEKRTTSRG